MRKITFIGIAAAIIGISTGFAFAQLPSNPKLPILGKMNRGYGAVSILGANVNRDALQAKRDQRIYFAQQINNPLKFSATYRYYIEALQLEGCCGNEKEKIVKRINFKLFTVPPGGFINNSIPFKLADLPECNGVRVGIEEMRELDGVMDWYGFSSHRYRIP